MTPLEDRMARDCWLLLALVGGALYLGALLFGATGCDKSKHPRAAAFATGAADCAAQLVGAAAGDVVAQAEASAAGAAGAPSWATFSTGELLAKGVPFAICVVEKAIAALDMKLPPAPADSTGNVITQKVQVQAQAHGFVTPPPAVSLTTAAMLTAHARLADWLTEHGATHAHATVDDGGTP